MLLELRELREKYISNTEMDVQQTCTFIDLRALCLFEILSSSNSDLWESWYQAEWLHSPCDGKTISLRLFVGVWFNYFSNNNSVSYNIVFNLLNKLSEREERVPRPRKQSSNWGNGNYSIMWTAHLQFVCLESCYWCWKLQFNKHLSSNRLLHYWTHYKRLKLSNSHHLRTDSKLRGGTKLW